MTTPATLAYVRRLSFDVLHRSPRPIEVRASVGMPVNRLAQLFLRKLEAMEQWVEDELFYFLLVDRFRPQTDAIAALPERLQRGHAHARDAISEILLSTGFSLRNPGNDTFVTVVLEQCLGVEVQHRRNAKTLEAGKEMYDGRKARFLGQTGSSQADVVRIVLEHPDSTRLLLDRHRRRLLGDGLEALPDAVAEDLVARVHERPGAFYEVVAEWLACDAYLAHLAVRRPKTDRQFVRSLYNDVLERPPTYEELRNVRNALQSMADATPLRAVMVKLVLESDGARLPTLEFGAEDEFVRTCFERYLGRVPGQQELAAFVAALCEPDTNARHVVRTLLASPEYGYC